MSLIEDIYTQINNKQNIKNTKQNNKLKSSDSVSMPAAVEISSIFDDEDILIVDAPQTETCRRQNYKENKCDNCGSLMFKAGNELVCEQCGYMDDNVDNAIDIPDKGTEGVNNYNTSDSSAAPVRITGPNSYAFQRKLISNTSNYKKQQLKNTIDQITNIIYQYKGPALPPKIVNLSAEFYYQVQQYYILRGDVRKGTMAACTYKMCEKHGITRKPKEIAAIYGIQQSELSNGEKILDKLIAEGKLSGVESPKDQNESFLSRYFECLNIPETHIIFTTRLVRFTIKYNIAESSIGSSKCAGAIYILASQLPELNITRDDIERECKISKSTFARFSQGVYSVLASTEPKHHHVKRRLHNIFKKNNVPLP